MKQHPTILVLFMSILFFSGCKKSGAPPVNGALSITGWSPARPSFGDELIISGTGFDTAPANNEVFFEASVPATVLEASSTQLKVIVPSLFLTPAYYSNIKIVRGAEEVISDPIYFSRPLSIINVEGYTTGFGLLFPGDSLKIEGSGFHQDIGHTSICLRAPGGQIDVCNNSITPVRVDSSYYTKLYAFFEPGQCIGGLPSTPDTATQLMNIWVSINNKRIEKPVRARVFPRQEFGYVSHTPNQVNGVYSISLSHKSILPGTELRLRNTVTNVIRAAPLVSHYRKETITTPVNVLQSDVGPGTWQISVVRNDVLYLTRTITLN